MIVRYFRITISSQACLGASRVYARAGCGGEGHVQEGAAISFFALHKAISSSWSCGYFCCFWIVIDVCWDIFPALYISLAYLLPDQFHWNTMGSKLPVAMLLLRFPHPGVENPTTLRTLCQQNRAWLGASRWHSGEPVESPLNMYQEHPWTACAWACAWRPIVRKLYYRRESLGQPPLKNTVITEEIYGHYIEK